MPLAAAQSLVDDLHGKCAWRTRGVCALSPLVASRCGPWRAERKRRKKPELQRQPMEIRIMVSATISNWESGYRGFCPTWVSCEFLHSPWHPIWSGKWYAFLKWLLFGVQGELHVGSAKAKPISKGELRHCWGWRSETLLSLFGIVNWTAAEALKNPSNQSASHDRPYRSGRSGVECRSINPVQFHSPAWPPYHFQCGYRE